MLQRLNYNFAISAILPFCKLSPIHATRPASWSVHTSKLSA